jgi:hypothetical protein
MIKLAILGCFMLATLFPFVTIGVYAILIAFAVVYDIARNVTRGT